MMMCVDAIHRVKQLSKEIRINQSLNSSKRKIPQRDLRTSKSASALSPISATKDRAKFKHSTLAEV